ncbi:3307_t:CDS:1, partial [Acaulospora colombiana]
KNDLSSFSKHSSQTWLDTPEPSRPIEMLQCIICIVDLRKSASGSLLRMSGGDTLFVDTSDFR